MLASSRSCSILFLPIVSQMLGCCASGSTLRMVEAQANSERSLSLERWHETGGGAAGWSAHVVVIRELHRPYRRWEVAGYRARERPPTLEWRSATECVVHVGDTRVHHEQVRSISLAPGETLIVRVRLR